MALNWNMARTKQAALLCVIFCSFHQSFSFLSGRISYKTKYSYKSIKQNFRRYVLAQHKLLAFSVLFKVVPIGFLSHLDNQMHDYGGPRNKYASANWFLGREIDSWQLFSWTPSQTGACFFCDFFKVLSINPTNTRFQFLLKRTKKPRWDPIVACQEK